MLKIFLSFILFFVPIFLAFEYFIFQEEITTATAVNAGIVGVLAGGIQAYLQNRAQDRP